MALENNSVVVENTTDEEVDTSFDLPVVESAAKARPRIHVAPGESACISCEG